MRHTLYLQPKAATLWFLSVCVVLWTLSSAVRPRVPCSHEDVTTLPTVWTQLDLFAETTLCLQESVVFFLLPRPQLRFRHEIRWIVCVFAAGSRGTWDVKWVLPTAKYTVLNRPVVCFFFILNSWGKLTQLVMWLLRCWDRARVNLGHHNKSLLFKISQQGLTASQKNA